MIRSQTRQLRATAWLRPGTPLALAARTAAIVIGAAAIALAQPPNPVTLSATAKVSQVKPGAKLDIDLVARISDGWHVYSIAQPAPPIATRIELAPGQPYTLAGDIGGPAPSVVFDESAGMTVETYEGEAAFTLPIKVDAKAAPGRVPVRVQMRYQSCDGKICLPPKTLTVEVPLEIVAATPRK